MEIKPIQDNNGWHRTGGLSATLSVGDIVRAVGFSPNVSDDESKVRHSWALEVDGHKVGIWDYKGARWSVYDPDGVIGLLFGAEAA